MHQLLQGIGRPLSRATTLRLGESGLVVRYMSSTFPCAGGRMCRRHGSCLHSVSCGVGEGRPLPERVMMEEELEARLAAGQEENAALLSRSNQLK